MSPSLWGLLALMALAMPGCAQRQQPVWVDLPKILRSETVLAARTSVLAPPSSIPAESFALPERPAELVVGPSEGREARSESEAGAAQAEALKHLQRRLQAIYNKQADLYASEQTALAGDLDSKALEKLMPRLRAEFSTYAAKRAPLVVQLVTLAGFPDNNPSGQSPPAGLSPLAKTQWLQANQIRSEIAALDKAHDLESRSILTMVGQLADQDRLALLQKIGAHRRELNDQAIEEAASPLAGQEQAVVLTFPTRPAIVLPPEPKRRVYLAPVPAPSGLPKVESGGADGDAAAKREQIRRQLSIWLALNNRVLAAKPGIGVPDTTQEFETWRQRQEQ